MSMGQSGMRSIDGVRFAAPCCHRCYSVSTTPSSTWAQARGWLNRDAAWSKRTLTLSMWIWNVASPLLWFGGTQSNFPRPAQFPWWFLLLVRGFVRNTYVGNNYVGQALWRFWTGSRQREGGWRSTLSLLTKVVDHEAVGVWESTSASLEQESRDAAFLSEARFVCTIMHQKWDRPLANHCSSPSYCKCVLSFRTNHNKHKAKEDKWRFIPNHCVMSQASCRGPCLCSSQKKERTCDPTHRYSMTDHGTMTKEAVFKSPPSSYVASFIM